MNIVKERTRLIFTDYTPLEKHKIEDLVASLDNLFLYQDPDDKMICLPTGMEKTIRSLFKDAHFEDRSKEYWPFARITPVEHNAQPRNQLQIDFIQFVIDHANNKEKVAGILSPGTGKEQPISTMIPTPPYGETMLRDIKEGDLVYDGNGNPTIVTDIFPQGIKDIYEITFSDGRKSLCGLHHLWKVYYGNTFNSPWEVMELQDLMLINYHALFIPAFTDDSMSRKELLGIVDIKYSHQEEAKCIMVDNPDHLYVTEDNIITHNTFMACYSSIKVGMRTLIIAPTSGIKEQWGETLTKMFKVPPEKVKVVKSPKDFINISEDFVVTSQASLQSLNKNYDLERIMKDNKFGIKVIDEVQMWFKNIIMVDGNSNIANNWYLTGTFGRSGETENKIYQEMFGDLAVFREKDKTPTIFNPKPGNIYGMKPHMHINMMWAHSGLSREEIKSVTNSMRYSEREGKWIRYGINIPAYTELVIPKDGTKTKYLNIVLKVIAIAEKQVTYGKTLILLPTIYAAEIVANYVKQMFPDKKVFTYHSRNSKAANDEAKATCDILVSTPNSCGTGFDLKGLAKLVVAASFKSWILADQVSGRLRRRDDGKDTFMWEVVDADVKQLRVWANTRADVYRRKAKVFRVIDI